MFVELVGEDQARVPIVGLVELYIFGLVLLELPLDRDEGLMLLSDFELHKQRLILVHLQLLEFVAESEDAV